MTSRWPHAQQRDEFVEEAYDAKRIEDERERLGASFEQMNVEGHTLNTRDWLELMQDAEKRHQWVEEMKQHGAKALELRRSQITLRESERSELLATSTLLETYIQQWKQKDEDDIAAVEESFTAIQEMVRLKPRLAAMITEDSATKEMVKKGLEDLKIQSSGLMTHVFGIEHRIYRRLAAELENRGFAKKLEDQFGRVEGLFAEADSFRLAMARENETLKAKMDNLRSEREIADGQTLEYQTSVTRLEAELQVSEQVSEYELSKLSTKSDAALSLVRDELNEALKERDDLLERSSNQETEFNQVLEERDTLLLYQAENDALISDLQNQLESVETQSGKAKTNIATLSSNAHEHDAEIEPESTLKVTRQLLEACAETANGAPISASIRDDMVQLQAQSSTYFQYVVAKPVHMVERRIPRMLFMPDAAPLTPMAHAIRFWLAVNQGRFPLGDTQALFNVPAVSAEMAAVYPLVLKALEVALGAMPSWERSLWTVQKILTVFQGIAYLNVLAQAFGLPLEGVQKLRGVVRDVLSGKDLFGSERLVSAVFDQVASSIDGQPLTSWINDQPVPEMDAVQRLDVDRRSVMADRLGQMFLLIDERSRDETLYLFDESEVNAVFLDEDVKYRLQFADGHLADRLGQSISLEAPGAHRWIESFLGTKVD
ncbi:MAG: hypothetical protein Q9216_002331 [Gyalolechia sp. 2 TL-2023]